MENTETVISSEDNRTRLEIWESVNEFRKTISLSSFGQLFCLARKRGIITWGEWYYLHDVLQKFEAKHGKVRDPKTILKMFIKNLQNG